MDEGNVILRPFYPVLSFTLATPPPPLLPVPLPDLNSGENSHLPFCLPLTWLRVRVLASRVDLLCRWFPSSSAPIYFSLVLWFFLLLLVGEFYQSLKLSSVTLSTYSSLFLPFVCLSFSLKKVFILFIFVYIFFSIPDRKASSQAMRKSI